MLYGAVDHAWTLMEIEEHIRSTHESVATNVAALVRGGLVAPRTTTPATYQYAPAAAERHDAVTQLAAMYRTRRVATIELIYARPGDPVRSFSEAFKLGRSNDT